MDVIELEDDRTKDMSHPIHADNCLLNTQSGHCSKQEPAYTWRDYSAIMYLNDDFEGGEFVFADNKLNIQSTVTPKCGRLVGFSGGAKNLHGVNSVRSGRRCALAMWFTLDAGHEEREHVAAQQVLAQLEMEREDHGWNDEL